MVSFNSSSSNFSKQTQSMQLKLIGFTLVSSLIGVFLYLMFYENKQADFSVAATFACHLLVAAFFAFTLYAIIMHESGCINLIGSLRVVILIVQLYMLFGGLKRSQISNASVEINYLLPRILFIIDCLVTGLIFEQARMINCGQHKKTPPFVSVAWIWGPN